MLSILTRSILHMTQNYRYLQVENRKILSSERKSQHLLDLVHNERHVTYSWHWCFSENYFSVSEEKGLRTDKRLRSAAPDWSKVSCLLKLPCVFVLLFNEKYVLFISIYNSITSLFLLSYLLLSYRCVLLCVIAKSQVLSLPLLSFLRNLWFQWFNLEAKRDTYFRET